MGVGERGANQSSRMRLESCNPRSHVPRPRKKRERRILEARLDKLDQTPALGGCLVLSQHPDEYPPRKDEWITNRPQHTMCGLVSFPDPQYALLTEGLGTRLWCGHAASNECTALKCGRNSGKHAHHSRIWNGFLSLDWWGSFVPCMSWYETCYTIIV